MKYTEVFKYSRPITYEVHPSEAETDVATELRSCIACAVAEAKRKNFEQMIAFEGRLWSVNMALEKMKKYTKVAPLSQAEYDKICNLLYKIYKKN